jgi:glucose-6-phosphate 1-dehydrogenase
LDSLRPLSPRDAVRGQYASGTVGGQAVRAYRAEDNVAPDSRTETSAALSVRVDNDRWRDVPFYIRTGKRMNSHVTTIALTMRTPAGPLDAQPTAPHLLIWGVDPQRGFAQRFAAKRPGVEMNLGRASLTFRYEDAFDEPPNVGYETLIYDLMCGQALLFQRADMIEREWTIVADVLDAWAGAGDAPDAYPAGSTGPAAADALLERDGNRWLDVAPLETLGCIDEARAPEAVPA